MIYRSNLTCPDLTPYFRHLHVRPMPHSFGHSVPSDWADKAEDDPVFGLYKRCGLWTHDEAAILYECARRLAPGSGLDIGAHTGWTTAHMSVGGLAIDAVDPILFVYPFELRFRSNMENARLQICCVSLQTSKKYFSVLQEAETVLGESERKEYQIVCIDGDHEPGMPLADAVNAAKHLDPDGVILFHDFIGLPVRQAVQYLMSIGFKARVYFTPHMVAACWRGDFVPPDHVPDPNLPDLTARCPDFDFSRCE